MCDYKIKWIKNWSGEVNEQYSYEFAETKRIIEKHIPTLLRGGELPKDVWGSYVRGKGYIDLDGIKSSTSSVMCVVQGHNKWMVITDFEMDG